MSPDDQARRIDGLLASYGQVQRDLGELEATTEALEKAMGAGAVEFTRILAAVNKSCDESATRLERAIADQGRHFDLEIRKLVEERKASKWTRGQVLTLVGIVFAPTLGIVLLLLGVGGPS
jgi:hypothetical protein